MKKFEHIVKVCILIFSMLSINLPAWGLDEYKTIVDFYSSTTYDGSQLNNVNDGVFSKTDNHVTFTINNLNKYTNPCLVYSTIGYPASKESTFGWSAAAHYEVKVTAVSIGLRGYEAAVNLTPAYGQFISGSTTGTKIDCKTNAVGGSGASTVKISNNSGLGSSAQLNMSTTSDKPYIWAFGKIYVNNCEFAITTVTYTYRVTHKEYLFGFAAVANKNISAAGNVSASVKDETVQAAVGVTSASTVATFTASASDGYRFEGWYDNSSYSGTAVSTKSTYQPTLSNAKAGSVVTKTLYAKFVPVTVNSVTPSSSTLTFTKPETKSVTLTFSVSNADANADFNTPTISNNEWTLTSWNYSNDKVTVVVSYTVTQNTSKGSDHEATITLTSKGISDKQSKSATVNALVDMNPVFTCNISNTYLVADAAINLASLWTSTSNGTISYTIENFVPSGINNDGAKEPKIVNNMLSLGQAGSVELKLTQAASLSYNAGWTTKTITIDKHDNVITISGFDDNEHAEHYIKTDWYDNELTLTASNTDYTHFPIKNERTQGDDTQASFGQQEGTTDKWVVYTAQNTGIVEWRLWQEENYKFKAGETTFAVKVIAPPCGCVLKQETWQSSFEKAVSEIGEWDFGGIGETLSFELRSNFAAGNHMTYSLKTDGEYETPVKLKAESEIHFTPVNTITLGEGDHNTTAVVFAKSSAIDGLNTDNPYVHNIVVTRKRWMKILDGAGKSAKEITSLPKMERYIDDDAVHVTFYVDFSTCDKLVKVASNYGHVTFSNNLDRDTISENTAAITTRGYNDKVRVDLSYFSNQVEEEEVIITIYTEFENKKLTVPVKTVGYIFKGTESTEWNEPKNWNVGRVPAAINDVTIEAPTIVRTEQKVHSMDITTGSVTIAPTGGLTVGEGGIKGADATNFKLAAGKEGDTKGQTGFVRINPNSAVPMPQATVELYSIGYYNIESEEDNIAAWQYVGIPIETDALAKTFFKKCWVYNWDESIGNWRNTLSKLVMNPFEGYATTQDRIKEGNMITFAGQLFKGGVYQKKVTANGATDEKGFNLLANSFAAPIDIAQFSAEDFSEGVDPTIYLFNTGSRTDASQIVDIAEKAEAKGQYLPVPVKNVDAMKTAYHYPTVIAPMQGFCIKTEKEGTVTLNYERLVWNGNYNEHPNTPLRTPKKAVNLSTLGSLCVTVSANGWSDNLYMLESDSYDKAFEAGYDAAKMNSGEFNVFALEGESRLAVDATNNIIGTYVGVRTGEETTYTLSFSHLMTNNELFLLDKEANEIVDIYDGVEYTFYAEPNTEITDRFQILGREKAPEVTTAIEEAADNDGAKVHKFIKDNQLYILKNGVLYNATGARVH